MAVDQPQSALAEAVEQVGDRWSLLIVEALLSGPRRFKELGDAIDGLAPNILSARLKHLERQGLLVARPYSRRPLRNAYELTAPGTELAGALRMLAQWAARASGAEAVRHGSCGTPLESRWYCPTCAQAVERPEEDELRYV